VLKELTIADFLDRVASGEPVPGGGSVAALSGALSAALSAMVARLTLGKKDDRLRDEKMSRLITKADEVRSRLANDIDRDAEAYGAVMKAYRMAKGTGEEKAARLKAIEDGLTEATRVPLSVAEAGVDLLMLADSAVREGNPNAVTDATVAALMARSSVQGALFNVRINLASLKDKALAAELAGRADELEKKAAEKEAEVLALARSLIEKGV
jgi:methenyltetrahydrofolate cyclohydrolase